MIATHNIDVRAVSSVVAGVTTVIGVCTYSGAPARTFYYAIQVPENSDAGTVNNLERRAIGQATDQFLLWVQNGKPTG